MLRTKDPGSKNYLWIATQHAPAWIAPTPLNTGGFCWPAIYDWVYERYRSAVAWEQHMNNTSVADKWEQKRLRHSHRHPPLINVNQTLADTSTPGQRIADSLAILMGSWTFIIIQSIMLAVWIAFNIMAWMRHWDPYPFILLNLTLSFQAAYAAPIIMMSQNRQAAKDRLMAEQDYMINTKAEEEVKAIMHHLEQQDETMIDLLRAMEQQHRAMISALAAVRTNNGDNSAPS